MRQDDWFGQELGVRTKSRLREEEAFLYFNIFKHYSYSAYTRGWSEQGQSCRQTERDTINTLGNKEDNLKNPSQNNP